MIDYRIEVDNKEVLKAFNDLSHKMPRLTRIALGRVAEEVIRNSVTTKLSGQVLKRKTGTLAKSLTWKMVDDFTVEVGTNVVYAAIHEFGGVIEPKTAGALHFKGKDGWVMTQRVNMPKRPFLRPALEETSGYVATNIIENTLQEYLRKDFEVA